MNNAVFDRNKHVYAKSNMTESQLATTCNIKISDRFYLKCFYQSIWIDAYK